MRREDRSSMSTHPFADLGGKTGLCHRSLLDQCSSFVCAAGRTNATTEHAVDAIGGVPDMPASFSALDALCRAACFGQFRTEAQLEAVALIIPPDIQGIISFCILM
jgi:hypothetical protein